MSNKNLRFKVRALVQAEQIRDKSDPDRRPGRSGKVKNIVIDIPVVEIPYTEFLQRISDAQNVILHGNVVAGALPPVGITDDITLLTHNSVRLNCTVVSQEVSTAVSFDYGLTEALGTNTAAHDTPINSADAETTYLAVAGLSASTKYFYRVKCVSATKTTYGLIKSFTTNVAPV